MRSLLLMPLPAGWAIVAAIGYIVAAVGWLLGLREMGRRVGEVNRRLDEVEFDRMFSMLTPSDREAQEYEPAERSGAEPAALPPCLPSVSFLRETFEALAHAMRRDLDRSPEVETGFALVGRIEAGGPGRRIIVNGLIEAGDRLDRSFGHVRFDRVYQQARLERMQMVDPRSSHIGDAHTHPGSLDHCSHGDLVTDLANVKASKTQEMVFVIATELRHHLGRRGSDAMSLYAAGLKLDVFYLGVASDYQYQRVVPTIVDHERAVTIPALLDRLADAFPDRFRLDWACLRSLKDWQLCIRQIRLGELDQDCLELSCQTEPLRIVIVIGEDKSQAPLVFIEEQEEINQFEPLFLAGGWTEHIWLTEVVLAVQRERASKPNPPVCQLGPIVRRNIVTV